MLNEYNLSKENRQEFVDAIVLTFTKVSFGSETLKLFIMLPPSFLMIDINCGVRGHELLSASNWRYARISLRTYKFEVLSIR